MDSRLLEYYNRELKYIRELGGEFASEYPKIAARLGLTSFECADPYVERLLEGFAFLAARVQLKIDAEFPRFSEQMLAVVCPHLGAPTPSMVVADFVPDERFGGLVDGFVVRRGTTLRAKVGATDVACDYRTAHDLTLWPLAIVEQALTPAVGTARFEWGTARPMRSFLRLRLRTTNALPVQRLSTDSLTLFFRPSSPAGWRLFELVVTACKAVGTQCAATCAWTPLPAATVAPIGTEDTAALVPAGRPSFQAYRLLHEYFAFPERYLFVRLSGLAEGFRACAGDSIDVVLGLDRHDPTLESIAETAELSLFAVPAINLFPRRADRIEIGDADHEYHVVPDRAHPLDYEVHSIVRVSGHAVDGREMAEFLPFYGGRAGAPDAEQGAYFTVQRRERGVPPRPRGRRARSTYTGAEVFVSLVDGLHGPFRTGMAQLSAETLCTNRDLPLLLPLGRSDQDFFVQTAIPTRAVRCVAGPSPPRPAPPVGELTWRLINHLSINYLALTDSSAEAGASALRELLSLYAQLSDPANRRQIAGVRSVSTQPIVRRLPLKGMAAFARGVEVTLTLDETSFEGTSAFVLGLVLAQFFRRYVSINAIVETAVRTDQRGEIARWPHEIGKRPIL